MVLGGILVLALAGVGLYQYAMHGGARDVAGEKPAYSLTAVALLNEFSTNGEAATKKYLNKTIEVAGEVSDAKDGEIALNGGVRCAGVTTGVSLKENVRVKGRVLGYDDMLQEVRLDQCSLNQ